MENSTLRKLMTKLASNRELLEKFKSALSQEKLDEAYELAKGNSEGNFTKEEFEEYISNIAQELLQADKITLTEKNLEQVAGGGESDSDDDEDKDDGDKDSKIDYVKQYIKEKNEDIKNLKNQNSGNKVRIGLQSLGLLPAIYRKISKIITLNNKANEKCNVTKDKDKELLELAEIERLKKELEKGNITPD